MLEGAVGGLIALAVLGGHPLESPPSLRRPARCGVAGRLATARPGAARRSVIAEMLASIGVRVWPGAPAVGESGREAWVERRKGALFGQIDQVRRRRSDAGPGH